MPNGQENQNIRENRNTQANQDLYTPTFLREHIGKLMKVEFLIGTNNLTDRIGILEDLGTSYILLRSLESDTLVYCDIYSIKFITISNNTWGYNGMNNRYLYY